MVLLVLTKIPYGEDKLIAKLTAFGFQVVDGQNLG
jgi:hypothetical protein